MKKFCLLAAAALFAVACGENTSVDRKSDEYSSEIERISNEFMARMMELQLDTLRDAAVVEAELQACSDSTISFLKEYCISTLKENKNNSLGVKAFKDIYQIVEPAEALELLGILSEENRQDESIVRIKSALETMLATSEGNMFTDFTVVQDPSDSLGSTVKFSDFIGRGKYVLVDFWASWCGPCCEEIPNIASVYETYGGDDFDVLSIAVWDEPDASRKAAEEHGIVWNQIINSREIATSLYGIMAIPQIMLFGPDGTLLKRDLRGERIAEAVSQALGR